MLYEYPDEFIVPITYINTSDCRTGKQEIKDEKRNRLEKRFRDNENNDMILNNLINENLISENQKDYYLENVDMYLDIDDEYVKDQTKKK